MTLEVDRTSQREMIIEALKQLQDPETGQSVWEMKLVRDLRVEPDGRVKLLFRPSSKGCPLAFALALEIKKVVDRVTGVTETIIHVENFDRARELEELLINHPQ